jgi:hypothetical protein
MTDGTVDTSPQLSRDEEGKVYSVRYEAVNAMLLNEFLKEHRRVEEQGATIAQQKKDFASELLRQQKDFEEKFAQQQKQIEALTHSGADFGIIVSRGGFTKGAIDEEYRFISGEIDPIHRTFQSLSGFETAGSGISKGAYLDSRSLPAIAQAPGVRHYRGRSRAPA